MTETVWSAADWRAWCEERVLDRFGVSLEEFIRRARFNCYPNDPIAKAVIAALPMTNVRVTAEGQP